MFSDGNGFKSTKLSGVIISQSNTLKQRAIHAGMWTIGGHVMSQALRFGSNLIMTRLLFPEMFGLMAIVTVIMVGLALFSDLGLHQNIIQSKRGDDHDFLDTIWSVKIIRGGLIWVASVLIALGLYLANAFDLLPKNTVYANVLLPLIIPVATLSVLISGFEPTWTSVATRRLQQSKITKIVLISQLFSILVMLIWAHFDRSIWALVAGGISASVARSIIAWNLVPEKKNKWLLEPDALNEIIHFGKWLFLSSILTFLFFSGDRLLLGGLITAKELGIYTTAYFIVNAASQVINRFLGDVAFPVLSESIRHKPENLINVYYRFRIPFDAGVLFLAGILFSSGSTIIHILYDGRYHDAGHMIEILSLTLIATRYGITEQCFMALGKPKIMTMLTALRTVTLFALVPIIFAKYQLNGALWAIVVSYFIGFPLTIFYKNKFNILSVRNEIITLPIFIIGSGAGLIFNKIF